MTPRPDPRFSHVQLDEHTLGRFERIMDELTCAGLVDVTLDRAEREADTFELVHLAARLPRWRMRFAGFPVPLRSPRELLLARRVRRILARARA